MAVPHLAYNEKVRHQKQERVQSWVREPPVLGVVEDQREEEEEPDNAKEPEAGGLVFEGGGR